MKELVKSYDFNTNEEFYNYILDSFINGQPKQARKLFTEMPTENRKDFVKQVTDGSLSLEGVTETEYKSLIDLI